MDDFALTIVKWIGIFVLILIGMVMTHDVIIQGMKLWPC